MKPRVPEIIWQDWPALAFSIGLIVIWLLYFVGPVLKPGVNGSDPYWLWPSLTFTALCGLGLLWRISRIRGLFSSGSVVQGTITLIRIVKDRGRIEFAFPLKGAVVSSWSPIDRTRRVLALYEGQNVTVLFDSGNPRKAIIQELYL